MKLNKLFGLLLTSVMLSSCGVRQAVKEVIQELPQEEVLEPDTTVYDDNQPVDLKKPQFRSPEDDEEGEVEVYVVDKVILHYYNEDGKCNEAGMAGRAFYVWCQGFDGFEYSNEAVAEQGRVEYSSDGTMMTITMDLKTDPIFKQYYGCSSLMYIIKYKMVEKSNENWGGQSEDVELKFSEFPPNSERIVEVWSTPAAGGGIAQFDSEDKTKVEGIKLAKFTNWKTITCTLSANATASAVKWQLYAFDETYFKVKAKSRAAIKKNYLVKEGTASGATFTIVFPYNVHINAVYQIESFDSSKDANGNLKKIVSVSFEDLYGTARFEQYYNYNDERGPLGVTYSSTETTFRVWSPVAANISLYLYNTDTSAAYDGSDKYKGWHMNYQPGGVWELTVKGDLANDPEGYKYYNYYVDTWSTSGTCMDPYATGCGACGLRGLVYDKAATNPAGWDTFSVPAISSPQELTIYEVQVQDFTGDESWGGPAAERGTYNGFVRTGTTLPSDNTVTTGFDHLKELGVGAVQFVPVFDSDNDEVKNLKYNWGYNPLNYNCVEGAYSSDPHDGTVRIREFKNMVNELAKANMRTIMDVVYNHVSSPTASCFNKLMPRYYFRYSKATDAEVADKHWCEPGELYDGSGCHNEFKSEATMARKFIVDSVCMWAKEYNIKGFRFDLMALIDGYTMIDVRKELYKIDPSIYIYGEGWTADRYHGKDTWYDTDGDGVKEHLDSSFGCFAVPGYDETGLGTKDGYQVYEELWTQEDHTQPHDVLHPYDNEACWLGAFDGSGRDALRGDNNPGKGFINHWRDEQSGGEAQALQRVVWGERADGRGGNPKQTVAYASCHDNYTLVDHLFATLGTGENSSTAPYMYDVLHATLAAQTIVFSANSAAFMYGGEEILRSKQIIFDENNPEAPTNNVTAEEFEKIPVTTYHNHYGRLLSHNSYNSPLKVNTFKWGNKVSVQGVHGMGDVVDMKAENLTAKYKALIDLHKEMPKYSRAKLNTIGPGGHATSGAEIGSVSWLSVRWGWHEEHGQYEDIWDDKAGVGIQYDDWFVFISCRNFAYFKNPIESWTQKVAVGVNRVDTENHSLNLGSESDPGYGFAAAVYKR